MFVLLMVCVCAPNDEYRERVLAAPCDVCSLKQTTNITRGRLKGVRVEEKALGPAKGACHNYLGPAKGACRHRWSHLDSRCAATGDDAERSARSDLWMRMDDDG